MRTRLLKATSVAIASGAVLLLASTPSSAAATANSRPSHTPMCQPSQLRVGLTLSGHAAGTTYYVIVFSRPGSAQCALPGYPGVSFVAPTTGNQVGAAASRNPRNPVRTILVGNGAAASALLGIANHALFVPGNCNSRTVSGLRVYPPNGATAKYVPFRRPAQACSTMVQQLSVTSVVAGTTGM